jgi:hypothetical protein
LSDDGAAVPPLPPLLLVGGGSKALGDGFGVGLEEGLLLGWLDGRPVGIVG